MNGTEYTTARNKLYTALQSKENRSAQEVSYICKQYERLKKSADEVFKEPPVEDLQRLRNMCIEMVNAQYERVCEEQRQAHLELQQLQNQSFVVSITLEENGTIAALASQYLNEFRGLPKGNYGAFQRFMNKVLADRLGALALLRFPQEILGDSDYSANEDPNAERKIPRSFIDKAIEKSKTPEALAFEQNNAKAIEQAEKKHLDTVSAFYHMGIVRDRALHALNSIEFFSLNAPVSTGSANRFFDD